MKTIYHIKASLMALATMVACTEMEISNESQDSINNGLLQELSVTGKDFQFEEATRSSVTIGERGASFTWDEDDVIGIFPDKGDQVSFAMDEGVGTQTATFSGGGWALKSSAKYAAYYPHFYENRDMTKIPVSYVGQTQNGNANTDHIGAYDFMAASVTTPSNGAVAFDMQHLGALVQLTITVPEPSTLTKVVLTSSTEFAETGTIDLISEIPAITAITQSSTFEIVLNNIATTEANENVTIYFMVAPIDLTDSKLTSTIYFDDAPTRTAEFIGKKLQAGKAYKFSIENCQFLDYIDEYGENHGKGVEIDGVVWAPVNCGYNKDDFKYGKLYQWGRKYGQGYHGRYETHYDDSHWAGMQKGPVDLDTGQSQSEMGTFFYNPERGDWLYPSRSDLWNTGTEAAPVKTEYDPCPSGWRVPTYAELQNLIKNHSQNTKNEAGQNGWWFSGSIAYGEETPRLFLCKSGYRRALDGNAYSRESYGLYWSSMSRKALQFYGESNVGIGDHDCAEGYAIRCVQE